jgi:hypothetical protein
MAAEGINKEADNAPEDQAGQAGGSTEVIFDWESQ